MANQLDLEEQEQLAQLKHYWQQYGNPISWALIIVLGVFASWNLYHYWQRNQAAAAAALFDEVERVVQSSDTAKMERVFNDMKEKFGRTTYAQQAGLLVAKQLYRAGKVDAAKTTLSWVVEHASDEGYQAVAKLRLAAVLTDSKALDAATQQLSGSFPASFEALVADRKGDILALQNKRSQAIAEYQKAYGKFADGTQYRRLVEIKLNSLGADAGSAALTAVAGAATEGKK